MEPGLHLDYRVVHRRGGPGIAFHDGALPK
jgi:hypothetical protein